MAGIKLVSSAKECAETDLRIYLLYKPIPAIPSMAIDK